MPAIPAIIGAAASIGGAAMSANAQKKAAAANAKNNKDTNAENYSRWLMSRGVGENGESVNTKYPLWMKSISSAAGGHGSLTSPAGQSFTGSTSPAWAQPNAHGDASSTFGSAVAKAWDPPVAQPDVVNTKKALGTTGNEMWDPTAFKGSGNARY